MILCFKHLLDSVVLIMWLSPKRLKALYNYYTELLALQRRDGGIGPASSVLAGPLFSDIHKLSLMR